MIAPVTLRANGGEDGEAYACSIPALRRVQRSIR